MNLNREKPSLNNNNDLDDIDLDDPSLVLPPEPSKQFMAAEDATEVKMSSNSSLKPSRRLPIADASPKSGRTKR